MQYKQMGADYIEQALLLEQIFGEARTKINELKLQNKLTMGEIVIIPSVLNLLNEAVRNYVDDSTGPDREQKMRAAAQSIGFALSETFEPWDMFVQYSMKGARQSRELEMELEDNIV